MIKCIAIDDEPLALAKLRSYIEKIPFLYLCKTCQDAIEAMQVISEQSIDLIFLDINMPDLSGIEFVRSLEKAPHIIFTTAYSEYAIDGFKLDAVDYILKPFNFDEFLTAANRARKRIELIEYSSNRPINPINQKFVSDGTIFVKSDYKVSRIDLDSILYIEAMNEYVKIYINGEEKPLIPLLSIKKLEEILPSSKFMRVHRSYIVNLERVIEIAKMRIIFGKNSIPIGDSYKEFFMEYVNQRLMK
ncbi:MAG: LytR/AlgR family response regulator transcription factor [Bacteroidales bacterium]